MGCLSCPSIHGNIVTSCQFFNLGIMFDFTKGAKNVKDNHLKNWKGVLSAVANIVSSKVNSSLLSDGRQSVHHKDVFWIVMPCVIARI